MGRKILITGGKGGVGKTSFTASIGRCLGLVGKKTVLVDGDIGLNNLDVALNAEDKIIYDVGDVASGKATIGQALIKIEPNLYLMPSVTACSSFVTDEIFKEIIDEVATEADYVFIDCPAGVERNFLRAAKCTDESIIVTTPHLSGVRDGYKTAKILAGLGYNEQSLVVNRVKYGNVEKNLSLSPEEIAEAMRLELIGIIPESGNVDVSGIADVSSKKDPAAISYRMIADYLIGRGKRLFDYRKNGRSLRSVIGRIKESL